MTRAVILNKTTNIVENIVLANNIDDAHVSDNQIAMMSDTANIGDHWNGSTFVQPAKPSLTKDQQNAIILNQLVPLDMYIPRGLEDMWVATGFDTTKLPKAQQDRLAQKKALRAQIQK